MSTRVVVEHITSLEIALRIVMTRTFIGAPINGDCGINCTIEGLRYGGGAIPNHTGAIMKFEWCGPIEKKPLFGYTPDVLYDEWSHRHFIYKGTTKYLRLLSVNPMSGHGFDELAKMPKFSFRTLISVSQMLRWLQSRLSSSWSKNEAERMQGKLTAIIEQGVRLDIIHPYRK